MDNDLIHDTNVLTEIYNELNKHSVIFQRFSHYISLYTTKSDDDKNIRIYRMPHITQEMFDNFNLMDIKLENTIFKQKCQDVMRLCKTKVNIFFFLEKTTQINTFFFACFIAYIQYKNNRIPFHITIMAILFICFVEIINIFGEWSKLREKYSHIYHLFSGLTNYRGKDRNDKFRLYSEYFTGNCLFCDDINLINS